MTFQKMLGSFSLPYPSSTLRKVYAASQLQNLHDAPGPARGRRAIEAAGGCMLQIVKSPACEELVNIFSACL